MVVCTHNRADLLPSTLNSLRRQTLSRQEFEVIVVDNASVDATAALLREYQHGEMTLRYEFEPRPGVSKARNRGFAAAQSSLVAFIDDDCVAAEDWLEMLLAAYDARPERPLAVGGKVDLIWQVPRPAWLPDKALAVLSSLDLGPDPFAVDGVKDFLYGCNILIGRDALVGHAGFSEGLGRVGENLISNEEVELQRRLLAAGWAIWYAPNAVVSNLVPEERLRWRWFLRRYFSQGVSDFRMALSAMQPAPKAPSLGYLGRVGTHVRLLVVRHNSQQVFNSLMSLAYDLGSLSEYLRSKLKSRQHPAG